MKNFKRFLSLALAVLMTLSYAPAIAYATEIDDVVTPVVEETVPAEEEIISTESDPGTYSTNEEETPEPVSDEKTLPNATVTILDPMVLTAAKHDYMVWPSGDDTVDRPLQIVMNFKANDTLEECLAGGYSQYLTDFYLTVTGLENGSIIADNCYLAGNYGTFGWIVIPADGLEIEESIEYPVVSGYDATLNYKDICNSVKNFTAAIYIDPAILAANPNMQVKLALKLTNPEDSNEVLTIGEPAVYDVEDLLGGAVAEINGTKYWSLQSAIDAAANGDTIKLIADIAYNADDVVYAHGGATGFGNYDQYNPSIIYVGGTKGATEAENQPSTFNATIDLNGHTITNNADAYLFLFMDNAKVTFTDSVGGGKVIGKNANYPVIWSCGTETLVTIEKGYYETASATGLLHSTHAGDLVITGGEFKTTADDASLLIMLNTQKYNNPNYFLVGVATVTIKGGTFHGFNPTKVGDDYGASSIEDIKFVDGVAVGYAPEVDSDGNYAVEEFDNVIESKEELLAFAKMANAGNNFSGKTVTLAADINLGGMTWTPVKNFLGIFDGGNHTISNFHLDATKDHAGFFYKINFGNGTAIKNLILSDITATVGNYYVGALAYFSFAVQDYITIKNFTVTTTASEANIGGYAGWVEWGHIRNCTIENMTVNAENGAGLIGGLAAVLKADSWLQYNNIDVKGFKVTINDTDGKYAEVGGLVGQTQTGHDAPVFTNCDISGIDVTASGLVTVGGFIARPGAHTTAKNCTTEGKIDVTGVTSADESAGGFFGNLGWNNNESSRGGHKLTNCSADVDIITKIAPAGGFVGSATNENNRNMAVAFSGCSATGDITCVEEGTADIGGFAGDADRGTYTNCTASGTVTNGGSGYAGQFIGSVVSGSSFTITDCTYTGESTKLKFIGNTPEDATVTIVNHVAAIGDVKYETLDKAIDAALAGDTITLLKDVTLTGKLTIAKAITIDGDGHSIIANHTAFILETSSDCTFKDITLDTNNKAKGVKIASGNVVFDNVTIPNSNKSDAITVYGTLTLKNRFTAATTYTLIDARSGVVNAEAGTVFDIASWRANASPAKCDLKGAVDTEGNLFFCAYSNTTYYKDLTNISGTTTLLKDVTLNKDLTASGTLNLNGNDLTIAEGKVLKVSTSSFTVTGEGKISGEISLTKTTATLTAPKGLNVTTSVDGYKVVYDAETSVYSVVEKPDVAEVNGVKYKSLQKALDACTNGETVKLIADITYGADDVVPAIGGATGFGDYYNPCIIYAGGTKGATDAENQPSNVNAVIDLNGHTITNNAEAYLFLIMDNAKVTFTDSSVDKTGAIIDKNTDIPAIWVVGTETLVTIKDGKYTTDSKYGVVHCTHGGDLVIEGGEFKTTVDDASYLIVLNSHNNQNSKYFITGNATITVKGGTFHGFNPEKMIDAKNSSEFNGCAEGYFAIKDANEIYTVEKLIAKITFNGPGGGEASITYPGDADSLQELVDHYMFCNHANETAFSFGDYTPCLEIYEDLKDTDVATLGSASAEYTSKQPMTWTVKLANADDEANIKAADGYVVLENDDGTLTVTKILASITFEFLGATEYYTYPGYTDGDDPILSMHALIDTYLTHIIDRFGMYPEDPTITLHSDIALDETFVIDAQKPLGGEYDYDLTFDLNGYTITSEATPAIRIVDDLDVTVKNGTMNTESYCFILGASDGSSAGNLTIESGTYEGNTSVASVTKGVLTIKDGEFSVTDGEYGATYLLNCIDANCKDGSAKIEVSGGIFHGFNPEDNAAENPKVNFCAQNFYATEVEPGVYGVFDYVKFIKEELLAGRDVTLERDIVVDGSMIESIPAPTNGNGKYPNYGIFNIVGDYDVTFDLNGHTITYNGHESFEWNGKTYNSCTVAHGIFFANAGADFTVVDNSEDKSGTVMVYGLASGAYVASNDTTFTIEGGTWKNEGCATCGGTNIFLYPLQGGELYIKGGHFEQALDSTGESYLIVEHGGEYKNDVIDYSKTKVEISGGTFVGMNPEAIKYFVQTAGNKLDMTSDPINGCTDGYVSVAVEGKENTWGVVTAVEAGFVAQNTTTKAYFKTVSEGLAAAKSGETVQLITDATDGYVLVPEGVTLDLGDHALTASYVVIFNDGFLTATTVPSTADKYGKLIVAKDHLISANSEAPTASGYDVLPVWNNSESYFVFSSFLVTENVNGLGFNATEDSISLKFIHRASGWINKNLLIDGSSDNEVSIIVRVEWTTLDGKAFKEFVYNDECVSAVASGNSYTFTMTNFGGLNNIKVYAYVKTTSGIASLGEIHEF